MCDCDEYTFFKTGRRFFVPPPTFLWAKSKCDTGAPPKGRRRGRPPPESCTHSQPGASTSFSRGITRYSAFREKNLEIRSFFIYFFLLFLSFFSLSGKKTAACCYPSKCTALQSVQLFLRSSAVGSRWRASKCTSPPQYTAT